MNILKLQADRFDYFNNFEFFNKVDYTGVNYNTVNLFDSLSPGVHTTYTKGFQVASERTFDRNAHIVKEIINDRNTFSVIIDLNGVLYEWLYAYGVLARFTAFIGADARLPIEFPEFLFTSEFRSSVYTAVTFDKDGNADSVQTSCFGSGPLLLKNSVYVCKDPRKTQIQVKTPSCQFLFNTNGKLIHLRKNLPKSNAVIRYDTAKNTLSLSSIDEGDFLLNAQVPSNKVYNAEHGYLTMLQYIKITPSNLHFADIYPSGNLFQFGKTRFNINGEVERNDNAFIQRTLYSIRGVIKEWPPILKYMRRVLPIKIVEYIKNEDV